MAFIPEDGTGVTGANSYCNVAYADAYFALAGNTTWAALDNTKKEQALYKGSQYIDIAWGSVFPGSRWSETQGLAWPRKLCCNDAVPSFPGSLQTACCEYAVRASVAPLLPDPVFDESGRQPTLQKSKVGPLEEEIRWSGSEGLGDHVEFKPYPLPDGMMRSFLPTGSTGGRVFR